MPVFFVDLSETSRAQIGQRAHDGDVCREREWNGGHCGSPTGFEPGTPKPVDDHAADDKVVSQAAVASSCCLILHVFIF